MPFLLSMSHTFYSTDFEDQLDWERERDLEDDESEESDDSLLSYFFFECLFYIYIVLRWISYFFCAFTSIWKMSVKMNFLSQNDVLFFSFLMISSTDFDYQGSLFAFIND